MKITERGWAGHFCGSYNCLFHRNTLIEHGDQKIIVSTVGNYCPREAMETIGNNRYYETMAFIAKQDGPYWDIDVNQDLSFDSKWSICAESPDDLPGDVDNVANAMHDTVVAEMIDKIQRSIFTTDMFEVMYDAWRQAGVDVAGGNWNRFVEQLQKPYKAI